MAWNSIVWLLPLLAAAVAIFAGWLGIVLGSDPARLRVIVPLSGGLLLGVCAFGLFPEAVAQTGWIRALLLFGLGFALLHGIDHWGFSVCPSCSHPHEHEHCRAELHGFTIPLAIATGLHALIDGWGVAASQSAETAGVRMAIPLAVLLHKIPEGLALGTLLEASTGSRRSAMAWCVAAELPTVAGGLAGFYSMSALGSAWLMYPLAAAGGVFLFLGLHAIHGTWKSRGARPAILPALTGLAAAAALQQAVRALFH